HLPDSEGPILRRKVAKRALGKALAADDRLFGVAITQLQQLKLSDNFVYANTAYLANFLSTAVPTLDPRLRSYATAGLRQKSELAVANYVLGVLKSASKRRGDRPISGQFLERGNQDSAENPSTGERAQGASGS
ncbi:MAG: hypothetical protein ABSB35_40080, partial [Bryobacteraceae bacterium]